MVTEKEREQNLDANPCEVCSANSVFRCSSCRAAYYCCRSHQTVHWREHRPVCKVRRAFNDIKKSKCHRADAIMRKRNLNLLKKLAANHPKDTEFLAGIFHARYQPDYSSTHALSSDVIKDLTTNGFSVVDAFLDKPILEKIRAEIILLCSDGKFLPGRLCQVATDAKEDARGDMVKWLDVKQDCPYTTIQIVVKNMDRIAQNLNASKILQGCDIRSRSPAMLAYYPENSPGYKQHVDNPSQDGRKLTFIIYVNKNYDRKSDGGLLRIYKKERKMFFDIEPIGGRLVIFWSDSRTPHEVLPTNKGRFALSVWYFDLVERARTLVKAPLVSDSLMQTRFIP